MCFKHTAICFVKPFVSTGFSGSQNFSLLRADGKKGKKNGGESRIQTQGGFPLGGFQDRCHRPLSHLSQNHFLFFSPWGRSHLLWHRNPVLQDQIHTEDTEGGNTEGTEWRPMLRMDRLVFLRVLEI